MKLAYFYLTPQGKALAKRLQKRFGGTVEPKECFAERVRVDFGICDGLVFIMAAGIAVRMLAPLIQDKTTDPAVVVLDQKGQYAVSLLSGHLGGANRLAQDIAAEIGGQAVITTATDTEGVPAFDTFAKERGLVMENLPELKYISGALAAGEELDLLTEIPVEPLPGVRQTSQPETDCCVVISHRTDLVPSTAHVLYLRPRDLVVGVGCKREIPAAHLEQCFLRLLEENALSVYSVKKIATIARKQREPAILALCERYGLPLEIVPDGDIDACSYPFAESAFVRQVTGLPAVAEACAYLASGQGEPLTGKVTFPGVTLSVCGEKTKSQTEKETRTGTVYVVGFGPGDRQYMTEQAAAILESADLIVGYTTYVELLRPQFPEQSYLETPMHQEAERCRIAAEQALAGKTVALVSDGDCGIYGMAGIMLETVQAMHVDIAVIPVAGVTAASAAAAVLGAPLSHDFAVISLSDLLTPLELILRRVSCAAAGDFVICLYNPRSRRRTAHLAEAAKRIQEYRDDETPVGIVRQVGRREQQMWLTTLQKLPQEPVDMFCVVVVGNSRTYVRNGRMITPRGYKLRPEEQENG